MEKADWPVGGAGQNGTFHFNIRLLFNEMLTYKKKNKIMELTLINSRLFKYPNYTEPSIK